MEFWLEGGAAFAPGEVGVIACSLDQRADCHLTLPGEAPRLRLGSMCGLRRLFPHLRGQHTENGLWLDVATTSAWYGDRWAVFSWTDFVVLVAVFAGRGAFVSFEQVAIAAWGEASKDRCGLLVHQSVKGIREKLLRAGFADDLIVSKKGLGLRLNSPKGR